MANYGSGERVGRCLPVGSFLCMAGGRDRSSYTYMFEDVFIMDATLKNHVIRVC